LLFKQSTELIATNNLLAHVEVTAGFAYDSPSNNKEAHLVVGLSTYHRTSECTVQPE